ncbi:ABC transporter ATP-binding protein/permease [Horticoccus luteus]|uniref:ABC transporter ATP-binding protein/permease n=1 Tax=Horticoccus luteus TaxID=2862869 RepID=A0A8F9XKZ7_9BACT|nr:ABC transporter ATP-binding protein [Horticoccus luteus]QYM78701.1 ABC transporter ATP-binding protein/permease [Horticoccus luteus]
MRPATAEPLEQPTLLSYLWSTRHRLWKGVGIALLRSLAAAPCTLIFQQIVDKPLHDKNIPGILWFAAIFIACMLLHYLFSVWGANEIAKTMAQLMIGMRSRIFFRLQFLSFSYLDGQKTGRLLSKYAFDTQKVESLLYAVLNQLLPNLLMGLFIFATLAWMNWQLMLILLLALPIYVVAKYYFFSRIKRVNTEARLAQEKLTGTASEYISALRLVRSFGEEQQAERVLDVSSESFARSRVDQSYVNALFGTYVYVGMQVLSLIIVAAGAIFVIHGHLSIGTLFAFIAGFGYILGPIHMFIGLSEPYFAAAEGYFSIKELIDSRYVEDWHGKRREQRIRGDIVYENVSFSYPSAPEKRVISNFNLTIQPGENIAFVGPSGSGKSTLANLLLGLYAPTEGRILIDGVPQADWDMRWMRRQMAVVMQDSILLSGSITDNIRFARTDATDAEIREAARLANAEEFILRMPEGFQTAVGERGVSLSGGQRQRIAIARSILRNPPVLILDEATSALDYQSEKLIQEALDRLAAGRTVITIAHRLSTIKTADRIIVLKDGEVIEQGNFKSLVAQGGVFAELIASQSTGSEFLET